MPKDSYSSWFNYLVLGLSVFLIFCFVFEDYIQLPLLLSWVGKWHPLVLHFPIVLLLGLAVLNLLKKEIPPILFKITIFLTLLTAISGFFLATSASDKGDLLGRHQLLGTVLALLSVIWYTFKTEVRAKKFIANSIPILIILLVLGTGHYGGMVTHGEDFLALPKKEGYENLPENPLVYQDIVHRILNQHCISCHNPNKKKGGLLMTSLKELKSGGEGGPAIIPFNIQESEIIRRLKLPKEDEEHMPPEGKKTPSSLEIDILEEWVVSGASDTLRFYDLKETEPLAVLIHDFMTPTALAKWVDLKVVADSTISRLNTDYLTINRISNQSNALVVNAYLPPEYKANQILKLHPIIENIIELDLSGLPIGEAEIGLVAHGKNIERLELDGTPLTDNQLDTLTVLGELRLLKVYNTKLGDKSLTLFEKFKNLKQLYLWNTEISSEGLENLSKNSPSLLIDQGIEEPYITFFSNTDTLDLSNKE